MKNFIEGALVGAAAVYLLFVYQTNPPPKVDCDAIAYTLGRFDAAAGYQGLAGDALLLRRWEVCK
jgi:hypothetical protein